MHGLILFRLSFQSFDQEIQTNDVYYYTLSIIFHIEMNLKKILKSLDQLAIKQKAITQKFSPTGKQNYVYRNCLWEDENEDLRIYGRMHSDTINKYKLRHANSFDQTKSQKNITSCVILKQKSQKHLSTANVTRAQTACKLVKKRPTTYDLDFYSKDSSQKLVKKNYKTTSSFFTSPLKQIQLINASKTTVANNYIRKQSILKYRKEFNQNFQQNLTKTSKLLVPNKALKKVNTVICENKIHSPEQINKQQQNNFFQLTQNKCQQARNLCFLIPKAQSLGQQFQILKKLNQLIFNNFSTYFLGKQRKNCKRNWNWEVIQEVQNAEKHNYYLICPSNLTARQIKYNELAQLHMLVQNLLKCQRFLHFFITKQEDNCFQLLYEEFIIAPNYAMKHFQWPVWFFRYYFRKFLILSGEHNNIQPILQQQKCFFNSYAKVPKKMYRFIYELKTKPYTMLDQRGNKVIGSLGQLLEEGYKQIEVRSLNWNKKGIKLSKEKRQYKTKKQLYFYICFFLLKFKKSLFLFQITTSIIINPGLNFILHQTVGFFICQQKLKL